MYLRFKQRWVEPPRTTRTPPTFSSIRALKARTRPNWFCQLRVISPPNRTTSHITSGAIVIAILVVPPEVPAPPQEVKIAAEFWNRSSGSKESTYQPSRLQKRKHQINSLAAQCAEQRVELEQRMRHGSKSKAQTAAKYGW